VNAIERAAREAVPAIADFSLVHLVDGARIRCVAGTHVSPAGRLLVRALMRRTAIRRTDLVSTAAHVIRTARPLLRTHIRPEPEPSLPRRGVADLQRRLAPRSVLVVPIAIAGAVRGTLSLGYADSGRVYTARQLAAARRLARRIADAIATITPSAARAGRRTAVRLRTSN
jgi:GAF domain-containing protein